MIAKPLTLTRAPQPQKRPLSRAQRATRLLLLALTAISGYALVTMHTDHLNWATAFASFWHNLQLMIVHPHLGQDSWAALLQAFANTIALAMLTTLLGAFLAFFLALATARPFAPKPLALAMRSLMAVIRAIPTILWVLVYATVIGLGNEAAVVGLTFHSVAYLTKAFAEAMETVPPAKLAALRATGCGFWLTVRHALWPEVRASLLSWTFIRFEINFTNAVAVGAAAGTGGIGYNLFMASAFNFDFQEVGLIVYLLLAFAICLEFVAVRMRKHLTH
ncbi:PhnE/PtxC family ABC transporter permease [Lacticaseibacillus baoqingensis]|uniref:PhnE/PtxC family ABC transporter permease n=1 Tax=Lacticaseibacillus baoqingensis TaxID=2486013 RepID=A0ABW4E9X1_9LACO|nr:ABC transporter permease subunit [Lacticaseibacillus baoqingensis]